MVSAPADSQRFDRMLADEHWLGFRPAGGARSTAGGRAGRALGARRRNTPSAQPSRPFSLRGGNSAKGPLQEKTMGDRRPPCSGGCVSRRRRVTHAPLHKRCVCEARQKASSAVFHGWFAGDGCGLRCGRSGHRALRSSTSSHARCTSSTEIASMQAAGSASHGARLWFL